VSTGNLLRAEVKAESDLGAIAEEQMKKGNLLPSKLLISLIRARLAHRYYTDLHCFQSLYGVHCLFMYLIRCILYVPAGAQRSDAYRISLCQLSVLLLTCLLTTTAKHYCAIHTLCMCRDCQQNGWLLDGFPRNLEQARMLTQEGLVPDCIIVLDRPDELVREFTLGRMSDSSTGITYHPKVSIYLLQQL
jgi:adenylate kinase family enzyme